MNLKDRSCAYLAGSCTRAREVMIFCTIKSKPLALPWGRTPRLDSGVRLFISFHALFYRRLGKWHIRGIIPISVGVTIPSYYIPDEVHPTAPGRDRTITQFPEEAVEVQKGEEQVTLFDSIKHCFVSLDAPAAAHQASGSGSGAGAEVFAPSAEGNVVEENVIPEGAFLDLTDSEGDVAAKRLRVDHPSLASGTGGKTLASLRWTIPEGSLLLGPSSPADIYTQ
ncbi:hypothetical protein Tco_1230808, partial [Tanacetum coccineum]